jgi:hypothetical protein
MERTPVTFADLDSAARWCCTTLSVGPRAQWSAVRVPGMEWTSREVVDHLCNTLAFYANHVVLAARHHQPRIRSLGEADLSDADVASTVTAWVRLLAAALRAAPADLLAWHPLGLTDGEGFLALACNELVIHASDVARAHEAHPAADSGLCGRLLQRLFPAARQQADEEPWQVLLWANGRPSTTVRQPQASWRSHPQPLDVEA